MKIFSAQLFHPYNGVKKLKKKNFMWYFIGFEMIFFYEIYKKFMVLI